jgi:phosphatidylserine/phosphatidylglycerophosphate/cardiolipin synthase-like enzyme
MKKLYTTFFFLFCISLVIGQNNLKHENISFSKAGTALTGKIKIYFNQPVNTTVSTGVNAVYLNNCLVDTLIAYINRAKYSIDVAVYNYESSGVITIATAINNAYARGVNIRWIYNGDTTISQTGLSLLNSNIHTLPSPITSAYGVMHNKFMIIDAGSANANDPIVWTGSANWTSTMFNSDVNNVIILQDQALAQAYTTEFNQMWGDTGLVPDTANSKFGPYKSDITPHSFTIDGITVEQYFSPSDGTNSHILSAINSANKDIYFGVYTFTDYDDANAIAALKNNGVYTAGIMDQYSLPYTPYSTLNPVMGSMLKIYKQTYTVYHNKFVIIDPSAPASDPQVETGSHNWTWGADTQNDENIVIVHDATVANIYYQSFYQNFKDLGGVLSIAEPNYKPASLSVYPNPATNALTIDIPKLCSTQYAVSNIEIYNLLGEKIFSTPITDNRSPITINVSAFPSGVYMVEVKTEKGVAVSKFIKE